MKLTQLNLYLCIGLYVIYFSSCMEEPLEADLQNIELTMDTLHVFDIEGVTYQIPPEIGSKNTLYLGSEDNFVYNSVLMKTAFTSSQSSAWTLSSFLDTSIVIDSAFFRVTVKEDTLETVTMYSLSYFPHSSDSVFSELKTNYTNFTDIDIGDPIATSSEEIYEIDSTNTGYRLNFPVKEILDSTFLDTTGNFSFLLQEENTSEELHSFYSREFDYTGKLSPKLDIYFRQFTYTDSSDTSTEVSVDTLQRSFNVISDLSIMIPPEVSNMDTSTITIGRGMGLRSLIGFSTLDSIVFPKQTSFIEAELMFHIVPDTTISSFSVWAIPLEDTVQLSGFTVMDEDDITVNNSLFSSGTMSDNVIRFDIRNFIQNHSFNNIENLGIKFYASINNNLHSTVHFYSQDHVSLYPKLLLQYVSP